MDMKLLSSLKQKLVTAPDLADIWEYFWDHFSDDPNFMRLGYNTGDDFLEQVIEHVATTVLGKRARLSHVMFVRLPKERFIHGTCRLDGRLCSVMYFEDMQVGCMAVIMAGIENETRLARFNPSSSPHQVTFSLN